jgi:hypothetical protein
MKYNSAQLFTEFLTKAFFVALVVFGIFLITPLSQIQASTYCSGFGVTHSINPSEFYEGTIDKVAVNINSNGGLDTGNYQVQVFAKETNVIAVEISPFKQLDRPEGSLSFEFTSSAAMKNNNLNIADDQYQVYLYKQGEYTYHCRLGPYTVKKSSLTCNKRAYVYQERNGQLCHAGAGGCIDEKTPITIRIEGLKNGSTPFEGWMTLKAMQQGQALPWWTTNVITGDPGSVQTTHAYPKGQYTLIPQSYLAGINFRGSCEKNTFEVRTQCPPDSCKIFDPSNPPLEGSDGSFSRADPYYLCNQVDKSLTDGSGKSMYESCLTCLGGEEDGREGVWTAVGCMTKEPTNIMQSFLTIGVMMAGGASLLMSLFAGFILSISQGDPKEITRAKELLTAAITGLIFILFSITILQFIGYSVLRIPGFGG